MVYAASFTNGTPEMVNAMVDVLPDVYQVKLNRGDAEALIWVLSTSAGYVSTEDIPEDMRERAESLFSALAHTLGIEGV